MPILPGSIIPEWSGTAEGANAYSRVNEEPQAGRRCVTQPRRESGAVPTTPSSNAGLLKHRRQYHDSSMVRRASICLGSDTGSMQRSRSEPSLRMLQESRISQAAGCITRKIGETDVNCPHALGRHRVHVEESNSGSILGLASDGGAGAHNCRFHQDPNDNRLSKHHVASDASSHKQQVSAPEHRYHFAQSEDKIPGLRQQGGYKPENQLGQALGRVPLPSNSEASSDYYLDSEPAAPSKAPVSRSGASEGSSDYYLRSQPGVTAKVGVPVSRSAASECSSDYYSDSQPGMLAKVAAAVSRSSTSQVSLISSASGRVACKDRLASTPRIRQRSVPARLDAPVSSSGASELSLNSSASGSKASRPRARGGTPRTRSNLAPRDHLASTASPRPRSLPPRTKVSSESDQVSSIGTSSVFSSSSSRSKQSRPALITGTPRSGTSGQMKRQKSAESVASASTRASQLSGTSSDVSGQEHMKSLRERMKQRVLMYKASGLGSIEPSDCGTVVTVR